MISPTTYTCRHSVTITWSKDHDVEYDVEIAGVACHTYRKQITFSATDVAAVSIDQSESYISAAALFSISAPSSKEEKVYLRLPSNWRELYKEFLEHRRSRHNQALPLNHPGPDRNRGIGRRRAHQPVQDAQPGCHKLQHIKLRLQHPRTAV
jgi:hypothetical protein